MSINLKIPADNQIFKVPGIEIMIGEAGIKKPNKKDITIFKFTEGTNIAAVFTKNKFKAAPVIVSEQNLSYGKPIRALLINTGNANAGTGIIGIEKSKKTCEALGELLSINPEQILPFSTGVIMEELPVEKIIKSLPNALNKIEKYNWKDAAYSIMTTDTMPKIFSIKKEIDGKEITITGISKGAGMIRPNMATMLGFIGTDIQIEKNLLNKMTQEIANFSFNRITVDGDTSTNDSFVIISTGKSGITVNSKEDKNYPEIFSLLKEAAIDLAQKIIRDAEGATKFITIQVENATSSQEALNIAYSIAHSPLVKTAFFASDPNVGRILAAIGYSNTNIEPDRISIWLDDVLIFNDGGINPNYKESDGKRVLEQKEITIKVILDKGNVDETVYTCDFSHDYITINAEYRS